MRPLPYDVRELVEDLEAHYPPRCKEPSESLEAHMLYAGQVALVQTLRARLDWTNENARIPDVPLNRK